MAFTTMYHSEKSGATICRLCFMERDRLEFIGDGDGGYLSEWIEKLTSVKIENVANAPSSLCSDCKTTLEAFDAFREMCITNDRTFKEAFSPDTGIHSNELPTIQIKIEFDEHQQTSIVPEEEIKRELSDVPSAELLIDVYEPKVMGIDSVGEDKNIPVEAMVVDLADSGDKDDIVLKLEQNIDVNPEDQSAEKEISKSCASNFARTPRTIQEVLADTCRYSCKFCIGTVSKLHIMTHKTAQLFQCCVCSAVFDQYKYLSKHTHKHHKDNNDLISIKNSDRENDGSNNVEAGTVDRTKYECKVCKVKVCKLHSMAHKADGVFQYHICTRKFSKMTYCSKHIRTHEGKDRELDSEDPWVDPTGSVHTCKICNKSASKLHILAHKAEGVFQCPVCERPFNKYENTKKHVQTHKYRSKFVCDHCGRGFPNKGRLNLHKCRDANWISLGRGAQ